MKSRARGGSDDKINLAWLCHVCHMTVHQQPQIPWTRKWRTFSWQKIGQTEHDFMLKYPDYYQVNFEAEYGMGYSKAKQLGRTE